MRDSQGDQVQWPPVQRLTAQGALVVYFLVETVGRLLDEFGVRWWMSSGAICRSFQPDCVQNLRFFKLPNSTTQPPLQGILLFWPCAHQLLEVSAALPRGCWGP